MSLYFNTYYFHIVTSLRDSCFAIRYPLLYMYLTICFLCFNSLSFSSKCNSTRPTDISRSLRTRALYNPSDEKNDEESHSGLLCWHNVSLTMLARETSNQIGRFNLTVSARLNNSQLEWTDSGDALKPNLVLSFQLPNWPLGGVFKDRNRQMTSALFC